MLGTIKKLFHIFFVGGLLLYVASTRENTQEFVYNLLVILGIVVFIVHAWIAYSMKKPHLLWVNYIHMVYVAPLLVYVGYRKNKTERMYYEMLLLIAFSAIGYHAYYLFLGFTKK
jgi:uncharacterized membrane protein